MKVVGLVTEYNPFHNGHLYHLAEAKKITGANYAVAIMSGNFLQRGEPALFNKWARAAMAVACGVDLVLELPFVYATRSAQYFARGAVETLDKTRIITHLCFGSEAGATEPLINIAKLLVSEDRELKKLIKAELARGVILPVAQTRALAAYLSRHEYREQADLSEVMGNPNNILGIEYIRALLDLKSKIQPVTVKRLSAQYHDKAFYGNISSATGIREYMKAKGFDAVELGRVIPPKSLAVISSEIDVGRGPVFPECLDLPLISRLRTMKRESLAEVFDVSEGLENRIIEAAMDTAGYYRLIQAVKSKRYAWTRIQRILIHALLDFDKTKAEKIDSSGPQYIRVLAFSEGGRELMHHIKKAGALPLISKVTKVNHLPEPAKLIFDFEVRATDLYTTLYPNPQARAGRRDYLNSPVML